MNARDAAKVIQTLNDGFHRDALPPESVKLWAAELATLDDGQAAVDAARLVVRHSDRFPTLAGFLVDYKAAAKRRRLSVPALPEGPAQEPPEWVQVWFFARWTLDDWRTLPQQNTGDPETISMAEYDKLREQWVAAGRPSASGRQIVGAMSGVVKEMPE